MAPRSGVRASSRKPFDTTDSATASVTGLKQVPYYSSKPGRDPEVNLNLQAYFPKHEGNDDELIECRHLAVAWLRQLEAIPGTSDYRAFQSTEAIALNVPRSEQVTYDKLSAAQTDLYILKPRDWGRFAAEQFRKMEHKGVDAMRMLVECSVHTMAAELKIKRKPGQPPQYVQKVYDPDSTVAHKRASTGDLGKVQGRSINDFLKNADLPLLYFGGSSPTFLVRAIPECGLTNLPEVPAGGPVDRRTANALPTLDATVMNYLLADGFGGSLRDVKPRIVHMAKDSPEEAAELLSAHNLDGDTGLHWAVTRRMADATSAFCDIVRDCRLTAEAKMELLSGDDATGVPALYIGMQEGCDEAVRALVGGIINSGLDAPMRGSLLAAAIPDGVPALFAGMQDGRANSVHALIDAIIDSDLGVGLRTKLLVATDRAGVPALFMVMQKQQPGVPELSEAMHTGQQQSVSALVDGLERSDLPHQVVAAVLLGRRPDGAPALAEGMRTGHEGPIRALMEGIANSTKLSVAHKFHLLSARNRAGQPALSVAVVSKQPRSVAVFVDVVAGSNLPHTAKRDLLLGLVDGIGVHALAPAVHDDHSETVRAYAEAVLCSGLPAPIKVDLLLAEHQGVTTYRSALAHGSDLVAKALREVVSQSSLSTEEQARVLDDAPRRRRVG